MQDHAGHTEGAVLPAGAPSPALHEAPGGGEILCGPRQVAVADSTLLTNWRRKASANLLLPSACSSSHATSSSEVSLPFLRFHAARVFWHMT